MGRGAVTRDLRLEARMMLLEEMDLQPMETMNYAAMAGSMQYSIQLKEQHTYLKVAYIDNLPLGEKIDFMFDKLTKRSFYRGSVLEAHGKWNWARLPQKDFTIVAWSAW